MFNLRNFVLLFALLTLASATAGATPILVTFNNGGPYSDGSVSVGIYSLTLGSGQNASPFYGPCLSDSLEVTGGQQWYGGLDNIVDFSAPTNQLLEQAAYIDQTYLTFASTSAAVTPIQYALWDIGNEISGQPLKYATGNPATVGSVGWYLAQAQNNYGTLSTSFYSGWSVLVPDQGSTLSAELTGAQYPIADIGASGSEPQYFLSQVGGGNPPSQTPEPVTMLMLGTALILLGCKRHRKN